LLSRVSVAVDEPKETLMPLYAEMTEAPLGARRSKATLRPRTAENRKGIKKTTSEGNSKIFVMANRRRRQEEIIE